MRRKLVRSIQKKNFTRDQEVIFVGLTGLQGTPNPKGWWETLSTVGSSIIPYIPADPLSWAIIAGVGFVAYRGYKYFTRLDIPDVSTPKVVYARTQEYNSGFYWNDAFCNLKLTSQEEVLLERFNLPYMFLIKRKGEYFYQSKLRIIKELVEENPMYQALDSGKEIDWNDRLAITQSYLISIKDYYMMIHPNANFTSEIQLKIKHLADLCTDILIMLHAYGWI